MNGLENIKKAYEIAHLNNDNGYSNKNHSFFREDVILHMYEIIDIFRKSFNLIGYDNQIIEKKKFLEIGCAWGIRTNQMLGFGIPARNLYGVDLLDKFINQAREYNSSINYEAMSSTDLKYKKDFFDFSFAVMTLSAMLDKKIINESLLELIRCTKDAIVVIDNFQKDFLDERNGEIYFKGVSPEHILALSNHKDIQYIKKIGTFWSTSLLRWRICNAVKKIGLSKLAYATIIRSFGYHSHEAYLIKLK